MNLIAIFGATGTIGSVLARRLVRQGQQVLLVGRNEEKLRFMSEELSQPFVAVDLSSSQSLEEALRAMADAQGEFHALVNCIGSILLKPAHATTDHEFRQVVETNMFTAFATVSAGAKLLRERGGVIVLFASAAAEIGIQNHEAIAAAKAAFIILTFLAPAHQGFLAILGRADRRSRELSSWQATPKADWRHRDARLACPGAAWFRSQNRPDRKSTLLRLQSTQPCQHLPNPLEITLKSLIARRQLSPFGTRCRRWP